MALPGADCTGNADALGGGTQQIPASEKRNSLRSIVFVIGLLGNLLSKIDLRTEYLQHHVHVNSGSACIRARPAFLVEACGQVPPISTCPPRKAAFVRTRCRFAALACASGSPTNGPAAKRSKRRQRWSRPCGVTGQLFFDVTAKKE